MAIFEKLEIHVLMKIFHLWVKIRNFWVPQKTPILTYSPYTYEVNRIKTHEMREKPNSGVFFPLTVVNNFIWAIVIFTL